MKKIILTFAFIMLFSSVGFANEEHIIEVPITNKDVVVEEVVDIGYRFESPHIDKDYIICIDIPKALELVEFKINGVVTDSKISELSKNYNRIYLPHKYKEEINIEYKVKVTDALELDKTASISFGMRDAKTGGHIIQNWYKTKLRRVAIELG